MFQPSEFADCFLIGTCGAGAERVGPPPGLIFVALGLVWGGVLGLYREWKAGRRNPPGS